MSSPVDFHSQIASIIEVLANAAVSKICKVVDDGYAVVHLEVTQNQKDNEFLRRKVRLLELQVAKYRAERMIGPEGTVRFPGARILGRPHREALAGTALNTYRQIHTPSHPLIHIPPNIDTPINP